MLSTKRQEKNINAKLENGESVQQRKRGFMLNADFYQTPGAAQSGVAGNRTSYGANDPACTGRP